MNAFTWPDGSGEHEDGGYVVHHGVDRGWWRNLRENLPGDVLTP